MKIYSDNGLPFVTADEIRDRNYIQWCIADAIKMMLRSKNSAWSFHQIEAPCLIPDDFISKEYSKKDVYLISDTQFSLKPETTASSYEYAKYLFEHQETKPPLCVWQASKSFRRENDQVSANMRLKEFYQLEFQCIVTEDTKMDYMEQETILHPLASYVAKFLGVETRIVESDRLPSYSKKTMDIEVKTPHKWLEVCSISERTDVPFEWLGRKLKNYEFAFGLDRLVYAKNVEN